MILFGNMQLSKKTIEKYKKIYKKIEGKKISDKEALDQAINLLMAFEAVYRPIPKSKEKEFRQICYSQKQIESKKNNFMKEKINQKGFILTPILIIAIIVILASSVGAGVVWHKQKKLVSNNTNTASISEAIKQIKQNEKVITAKDKKIKQEIDEYEIVQPEQKLAEKSEPELGIEIIEEETEKLESIPEVEEPSPDPCADIVCPDCQHCLNSNCVARPDGYNDCGSGCQRCVNGFCQDSDDACSNCQYCDSDVCIDNCKGTDASCGCNACLDCNKSNGWVDIDSPYSCCDGDKKCICQKQEYQDYSCSDISCRRLIASADTKINKSNCSKCSSSDELCVDGSCRKIFETSLSFPMIFTAGGNAQYLDFSLSNNSSQTITINKIEFFNKDDKLVHTISAEDIAEIWESAIVVSGDSFSGSFQLKIMYSTQSWHVKWYYLDSNGIASVVSS